MTNPEQQERSATDKGSPTESPPTVSSRISRAGFWKRIIPLPVVGFILLQLDFRLQTGAWGIAPSGPALLFYWTLIGAVIFIVACVKRAHDRNKSGWWTLVYIIPYIGWLWALIELGCLEGTKGPNRFGADPRDGQRGN